MSNLVAVDLPQNNKFLQIVKEVWDSGDAVFVIDQRFSPSLKKQTIESIRPKYLIDSNGKNTLPNSVGVSSNDALVQLTSGTTGYPKSIIHTFDSLKAHGAMVNEFLKVNPKEDRWIACLPLSHIGGLGVVMRAYFANMQVEIIKAPDKTELERLNANGYNMVSLVASILDRINVNSYKAVVIGGMAEPDNVPDNVFPTYGLSESGGGVVYKGECLRGVRIKIQPGSQLIEIDSPTLLRAYRSMYNSALGEYVVSKQGIAPELHDGYFVTSDCGYFENDRLKILGRRDDLINTGGEKIWAKTLEDIILSINGIDRVCVMGLKDQKWGQKIVAAVVKSKNSKATSEDIIQTVKNRLASWAVPKEIQFVDDLPKTAIQKIDRAAVTKLFDRN